MSAQDSHRFRNYVRKRMRERQIKDQATLAAKVGLKPPTLSRLINGKVEDPELPTFVLLAEALEDPLWRVLEEAGYKIERPADPSDSDRQLARQIELSPELRPIVEDLFALDADDRSAVVAFLQALRRRRGSGDL